MARVKLESHDVTTHLRPMEFVFFIAVQKVIFRRPSLDGSLNGESHRGDSNAVLGEGRIKPRLVKIKRRSVVETIERRGRSLIERNNQKTQPSAFGRQVDELAMKGYDGS